MLEWLTRLKRRKYIPRDRADADTNTERDAAKRRGAAMSGNYSWLYKYLENRYANTVVLTFAEIEDLLGFALPDPARLRQDWWTNTDPDPATPNYSHSWILASRTATPNLLAQTVVFERLP